MKSCRLCSAELDEHYKFCPDDGSILDQSFSQPHPSETSSLTELATKHSAEGNPPVVRYCPVCASEFPPTFQSCPAHQTPLIASVTVSAPTATVVAPEVQSAAEAESPGLRSVPVEVDPR